MRSSRRVSGVVVVAVGLAGGVGIRTAHGQQSLSSSWQPAARLQADVRYDDNPFLLTPLQKPKLQTVSAADALSGRFRDMTSVADVIPVMGIHAGLAGPALFGRPLALSVEADYAANARNTRRRHAELRFEAQQALPKGGRLRLRADVRPNYFWKNYLSDAADLNADSSITADERRYEPGTSDEVDLTVNYRHRFRKVRPTSPWGLTGELEAGYFRRSYDAPFRGRSRRGPGAGASLTAQAGARWTIGVDYSLQSLSADTSREVLILDEPDFAHDFNGNGSITDLSARAFELVDRSRVEHNLGASVQVEVSDRVTLDVTYALRSRRFSSTQPYDVSDRGRRDTRNELGGGLDVRLAERLRLTVGAAVARQNTNRAGDPGSTGDVADYTRRVVTTGFGYRF